MLSIDTPRGKRLLTEVEKIDPEGEKERKIEKAIESENHINLVYVIGVIIFLILVAMLITNKIHTLTTRLVVLVILILLLLLIRRFRLT